MNICTYCDKSGVSNGQNIFICSDRKCHDINAQRPDNNAVCSLFKNNAPELEFMIRTTFAAAASPRWEMILNPFPWFFKEHNHHADTKLGMPIVGADIDALRRCISSITIDDIMEDLFHIKTDVELLKLLGRNRYNMIKWIVETKTIDTEFSELRLSPTTKQMYKQFKIHHSSQLESEFMNNEKTCFLLHGSDIVNWHSIIRNGIFNASNTKLMTAGAAYGPGVYLSDTLTISNSYSRGSVDNTTNMVVAVFQVKGDKKTYHKSSHIYVVPDANNLLLRYLINVPRNVKLDDLSKVLEERFCRSHENDLKMVIKVNDRQKMRIEQDLKQLKTTKWIVNIVKYSTEMFVVTAKITTNGRIDQLLTFTPNIVFGIRYTSDYPFEPPIIWVRSPHVQTDLVLPSGVLANQVLCRANWHAKNNPSSIISELLNTVVPDDLLDGIYDDTDAVSDAMKLR